MLKWTPGYHAHVLGATQAVPHVHVGGDRPHRHGGDLNAPPIFYSDDEPDE